MKTILFLIALVCSFSSFAKEICFDVEETRLSQGAIQVDVINDSERTLHFIIFSDLGRKIIDAYSKQIDQTNLCFSGKCKVENCSKLYQLNVDKVTFKN